MWFYVSIVLTVASNITSTGGSTLNPQMRNFGGVVFWGCESLYVFFFKGKAVFVNVYSKIEF